MTVSRRLRAEYVYKMLPKFQAKSASRLTPPYNNQGSGKSVVAVLQYYVSKKNITLNSYKL